MDRLLSLLEDNARLSFEELGTLLNITAVDVAARVDEYKKNGVIRGFRTLVNHEAADSGRVQSIIELKVAPKKNVGFEEVAKNIAELSEVDSVQLISGGYDLMVIISGTDFKEIANFVAKRLSPIDAVLSTATHFVLRTYKKDGVLYHDTEKDEREMNV